MLGFHGIIIIKHLECFGAAKHYTCTTTQRCITFEIFNFFFFIQPFHRAKSDKYVERGNKKKVSSKAHKIKKIREIKDRDKNCI